MDREGTISAFATNPNFRFLGAIKVDFEDSLYVADSSTCVVWKITTKGTVSVFARQINACSYNGDNIPARQARAGKRISTIPLYWQSIRMARSMFSMTSEVACGFENSISDSR